MRTIRRITAVALAVWMLLPTLASALGSEGATRAEPVSAGNRVVFLDWDETERKALDAVPNGTAVALIKPGEVPSKTGYRFMGWEPAQEFVFSPEPATLVYTAAYQSARLYEVTVEYRLQDADGPEMAPAFRGSYVYGELFEAPSPRIAGYTCDLDTVAGTAGQGPGGAEETDLRIVVLFTPLSGTPYRVVHHFQNLYDSGYDADQPAITEERSAGAGMTVEVQGLAEAELPAGFMREEGETTLTVAADGSSVAHLYYSRSLHTLIFDTQGGEMADPFTGRYGAPVPRIQQPSRPGYAFAGWDAEIPDILTEDRTFTALWQPEKTTYAVVYWLQNADDDGYSYRETVFRTGLSGNTAELTGEDLLDGRYPRFVYREHDRDVPIRGDGSSVVNVYYDRKLYTLAFDLGRGRASLNIGGRVYAYPERYEFTARYEADIAALWPDASRVSNEGGLQFHGWGRPDLEATYVSKRFTLSGELLDDEAPLVVYTAVWKGALQRSELHYMVESLTDSGDRLFDGTWYSEESAYRQTAAAPEGNSWRAKEISGLTARSGVEERRGARGGETEVWFYYDRNLHPLSFFNHSAPIPEKTGMVRFGADISDRFFVPERPAGVPEGYAFVGWYTNRELAQPFDWEGASMPAGGLELCAAWKAPDHTVLLYIQGQDGLYFHDAQTVPHGGFASRPADPIGREGYAFDGWYYVVDGVPGSTPFSFESHISRDLSLYGRWEPLRASAYTVRYREAGREEHELAPDKTVVGVMQGTMVTEVPADIETDGAPWYPDRAGETFAADLKERTVTFLYSRAAAPYTVRLLDRETGLPLAEDRVVSPRDADYPSGALVTVTAPDLTGHAAMAGEATQIQDLFPEERQKTLRLTASAEQNVLEFYYTRPESHQYRVEYLEAETGYRLFPDREVKTSRSFAAELAPALEGYTVFPAQISIKLAPEAGADSPKKTLTFLYTPVETLRTVRRAWDDGGDSTGIRPKESAVVLKGTNGRGFELEKDTVLRAGEDWQHTFSGLPGYAGGLPVAYSLMETETAEGYEDGSVLAEPGSSVLTIMGSVQRFSLTVSLEDGASQVPHPEGEYAVAATVNGERQTFSLRAGESRRMDGLPYGTTYSLKVTRPSGEALGAASEGVLYVDAQVTFADEALQADAGEPAEPAEPETPEEPSVTEPVPEEPAEPETPEPAAEEPVEEETETPEEPSVTEPVPEEPAEPETPEPAAEEPVEEEAATPEEPGESELAVEEAGAEPWVPGLVFASEYRATGFYDIGQEISLRVNLTGRPLKAGEFSYELLTDDTLLQTVSNDAEGYIRFAPLAYTEADIGKTYAYTVREALPTQRERGMKGGSPDIGFTVSVEDLGNGELAVRGSGMADIVFQREYTASGSFDITRKIRPAKALEGRPLKAGEFSFELRQGEAVLQTVVNAADGSLPFEPLSYTQEDIGRRFEYEIHELAQESPETGMAHTPHILHFSVEVEDLGDGKLLLAASCDDDRAFRSRYRAAGSFDIEGHLNPARELTGRSLKAGEFLYELLLDGAVLQRAANDIRGSIPFAPLDYTEADIGRTYVYSIREVIPGMPEKGMGYDTREPGFTVTVEDLGQGELSARLLEGEPIVFRGEYRASGTFDISAVLKLSKQLAGRPLKAGEFTYVLFRDGDALQTARNGADGAILFDPLVFTQEDIGQRYGYAVRELTPRNPEKGMSYDSREIAFTVTVEDRGNGELAAEATQVEDPVFRSVYRASGRYDISRDLMPRKELSGRLLKAGEFTFELRREEALLQTGSNEADGSILFEALEYTEADIGQRHAYTLGEISPEQPEGGMSYDPVLHAFFVTVRDLGNGELETAAEIPEEPVFRSEYRAGGTYDFARELKPVTALDGRPLRAGEFAFELWQGETLLQSARNRADGSIPFEALNFTEADIGKEYGYTIRQAQPETPERGMNHDLSDFAFTLRIGDLGNGLLTADSQAGGNPVFQNAYRATGEYDLGHNLNPQVELTGRTLKAGEFAFELWQGETLLQTVRNDDRGSIPFENLRFTETDIGKAYAYEIRELIPEEAETGMVHDPQAYAFTAEVEDEGDGVLAVTVSGAGIPVFRCEYYARGAFDIGRDLNPLMQLEGRPAKEGEFIFELLRGNAVLQSVGNREDGSLSFENLEYSEEDIDMQYRYAIRQRLPETPEEGMEYDGQVFAFTVSVRDGGNGRLTAATSDGDAVFVNAYRAAGEFDIKQELNPTKTLTGRALKAGEFNFGLWLEEELLQTAANEENGDILFEKLVFSQEDIGKTFVYTIRELPPDKPEAGMSYDSRSVSFAVSVEDLGNGMLSASLSAVNGEPVARNR